VRRRMLRRCDRPAGFSKSCWPPTQSSPSPLPAGLASIRLARLCGGNLSVSEVSLTHWLNFYPDTPWRAHRRSLQNYAKAFGAEPHRTDLRSKNEDYNAGWQALLPSLAHKSEWSRLWAPAISLRAVDVLFLIHNRMSGLVKGFGRRPSERARIATRAGIRNPSPKTTDDRDGGRAENLPAR
jgi:hypothetical protein